MVFDVNFGHGKRTRRPKSENDVEKKVRRSGTH